MKKEERIAGTMEKPSERREREERNAGTMEKPSERREREERNVGMMEKPSERREREERNAGTMEKPSERGEREERNVGMMEKPSERSLREREERNAGMTEKPEERREREERNAGTMEKPEERGEREESNAGTTEKPSERGEREESNAGTMEKPEAKQQNGEERNADTMDKPSQMQNDGEEMSEERRMKTTRCSDGDRHVGMANKSDGVLKVEMKRTGDRARMHNPVDRGWAWVILICLFLIQAIGIGFIRSFGVLFVGIQGKFDSSASMVSLIPGIQGGVFSISAMLTLTFLIDLMHVRTLVILGGFLASSGLALCFLAESIQVLVVSQAVAFGVGFSMVFGPGFVLLGNYFVKRRPLAAPIGNTGGSIGGLVMPLVTRLLLEEYGLSGTYLLLGGIFAQVIVLGSLYTPPTDYKVREHECITGSVHASLAESMAKEHGCNCGSPHAPLTDLKAREHNCMCCSLHAPLTEHKAREHGCTCASLHTPSIENKVREHDGVCGCLHTPPTPYKTRELNGACAEGSKESLTETSANANCTSLSSSLDNSTVVQLQEDETDDVWQIDDVDNDDDNAEPLLGGSVFSKCRQECGNTHASDMFTENQTVSAPSDIMISSDHNLSKINSDSLCSLSVDGVHISPPELFNPDSEMDAEDNETKPSPTNCVSRCCSRAFDMSLFKSPLFWLLLLYGFFGIVGSGMPTALFPPLAVEKGLSMADGVMLVMISAGLDIGSRLLPGFVAQLKWMKPHRMVCIAFLIQGVVFQFTSLFNSLPQIVVLAVVHGLCAGVFPSTLQLVIIDFMGHHRFPKSLGFVQLILGLSGAVFFPFFGYLRDVSGSYVLPFHVTGFCLFIALVSLLLEPAARRLEKKMADTTSGSLPVGQRGVTGLDIQKS